MDDCRTFGQIVREARLERRKNNPDFSLRKFAVRVGISPTYLSKAETDEFTPPRAEKVVKIAEELGLDKYFLLTKANHIEPNLKRILLERQEILSELIQIASEIPAEKIPMAISAILKIKGESHVE